uniref:Uncharacterized protein n=1 Tax=Ananas comosus var. bracteatus TaxID=296719 RepID=A0A6V7P4Y5_ANACO|nr:unnamed protein product [Ananas comosus var. bracteatus]
MGLFLLQSFLMTFFNAKLILARSRELKLMYTIFGFLRDLRGIVTPYCINLITSLVSSGAEVRERRSLRLGPRKEFGSEGKKMFGSITWNTTCHAPQPPIWSVWVRPTNAERTESPMSAQGSTNINHVYLIAQENIVNIHESCKYNTSESKREN